MNKNETKAFEKAKTVEEVFAAVNTLADTMVRGSVWEPVGKALKTAPVDRDECKLNDFDALQYSDDEGRVFKVRGVVGEDVEQFEFFKVRAKRDASAPTKNADGSVSNWGTFKKGDPGIALFAKA